MDFVVLAIDCSSELANAADTGDKGYERIVLILIFLALATITNRANVALSAFRFFNDEEDFATKMRDLTASIDFKSKSSESVYARLKQLVMDELKDFFRPEFINRLDEIIVFRQLTRTEVGRIAELMLREVVDRASGQGVQVYVTNKLKTRLVKEGYNPVYGARPLRRAITKLVEDPLTESILFGGITPGDSVLIDVDLWGKVTVTKNPSPDANWKIK